MMRNTGAWCTLAPALAWAVCGCGSHEMGAKAPAFGGPGKLATTAGFLEGRWKYKVDDSMVSFKAPSIGTMGFNSYLEFGTDHTCKEYGLGNVVHMTWKEAGSGIKLTVVDVDGYDPATISAGSAAEHEANQSARSRRLKQSAMASRALALLAAPKRLELMTDKKRLFNPASINSDGSSRMGLAMWVRME